MFSASEELDAYRRARDHALKIARSNETAREKMFAELNKYADGAGPEADKYRQEVLTMLEKLLKQGVGSERKIRRKSNAELYSRA